MKISVLKENIQKALAKAQGIVEKRSTYPILSHVLINASQEGIFLEATDLQINVKESFSAQIEEPGRICVPARKFYEITRELPPDTMFIKKEENYWINVNCGTVSLRLPGLDPQDFPSFPTEGKTCTSIDAFMLKGMLEKVAFAASTQESPMNLHGVLFEFTEHQNTPYIRLVATDGHRLAIAEENIEEMSQTGEFIVPKRGVNEIRRLFSDERIQIRIGENTMQFVGKNTMMGVRLLEGQFPDYKHVLPKELEKKTVVDRKMLLSCLKRAEILASERGEGVKLKISPDTMEVHAGGGDVGEFSEKLKVNYLGESISIVFNGRYLIEALTVMDTEFVRLELRDEESAGLLKPEEKENYIYLVMPMKIT